MGLWSNPPRPPVCGTRTYGRANTAQARASIKGEKSYASAKAREQALLARHRER